MLKFSDGSLTLLCSLTLVAATHLPVKVHSENFLKLNDCSFNFEIDQEACGWYHPIPHKHFNVNLFKELVKELNLQDCALMSDSFLACTDGLLELTDDKVSKWWENAGGCQNTQMLQKPHKTKKACKAADNCKWVDEAHYLIEFDIELTRRHHKDPLTQRKWLIVSKMDSLVAEPKSKSSVPRYLVAEDCSMKITLEGLNRKYGKPYWKGSNGHRPENFKKGIAVAASLFAFLDEYKLTQGTDTTYTYSPRFKPVYDAAFDNLPRTVWHEERIRRGHRLEVCRNKVATLKALEEAKQFFPPEKGQPMCAEAYHNPLENVPVGMSGCCTIL